MYASLRPFHHVPNCVKNLLFLICSVNIEVFVFLSEQLEIIESLSAANVKFFVNTMMRELNKIMNGHRNTTDSRPKRALTVAKNSDGNDNLSGIINNYIVQPWTSYLKDISDDFPTDAVYGLFSHDYLDTTRFTELFSFIGSQAELSYKNCCSFFRMPEESIGKLSIFFKRVYNEFPEINRRELDKEIYKYIKSIPILNGKFQFPNINQLTKNW